MPELFASPVALVSGQGYQNPEGCILINFTGYIQDEELEDAVREAYAKHGANLVNIIRSL